MFTNQSGSSYYILKFKLHFVQNPVATRPFLHLTGFKNLSGVEKPQSPPPLSNELKSENG